jgi:hypothetical protein
MCADKYFAKMKTAAQEQLSTLTIAIIF